MNEVIILYGNDKKGSVVGADTILALKATEVLQYIVFFSNGHSMYFNQKKGTSRQRSGKGAIRKRFPLQKPRWEKTKLTIRHLYHALVV